MFIEYKNEPFENFNLPETAEKMRAAIELVDSQKGKTYSLVIGGNKIETKKTIVSYNPSQKKEVIGIVSSATREHAQDALQSAIKAFASWKRVNAADRANYLFKIAAIIRRRKFEFSAWLVEEAGKNWAEADADTAEAIDFLEYYARQMLQLDKGMSLYSIPGEHNVCNYIPLGVGLVVSPWNFPFAILVGMTAAAIVTGNTVIMKPASVTPVIAAKFMEVLEEASLPAGVVNFLPGPGEEVGDYLVSHPNIRFINFTGSKEVGIRINKMAAEVVPGQIWLKRVVAEMGGKDSILVDNEADLDAAAQGIVDSAFGFQGQKCSACSRAVVVEDVYDALVEKVVEKVNRLKVGPAREYGNAMGPVVDEKSYQKVLEYIEIGKTEGTLVSGDTNLSKDGYYIAPTVIKDVGRNARIAQEEIFGPVLAIIKAKNFDDGLDIVNNTEYGLTGAIYSKNREKLERAKRDFHVGNLYLNRKCTGALVGVQPFGGFNMSGTDSKAGGSDYLLLFLQAKTICERM